MIFRLDLESGDADCEGVWRQLEGSRDVPDGRYLAYIISSNAGGMEGRLNLSLIDLSSRTEINPAQRLWKIEKER